MAYQRLFLAVIAIVIIVFSLQTLINRRLKLRYIINKTEECPVKQQRLPDALIFGAKKCGTGALLQFLRLHPDIVAPDHELHFFNVYQRYSKGAAYYKSKFSPACPGAVVLEKTPAYFVSPNAPTKIKKLLGLRTRLILVVRNPVDRFVSEFLQERHVEQCLRGKNRSCVSSSVLHRTLKSGLSFLSPFSQFAFLQRKPKLIVNDKLLIHKPGYFAENLRNYLNEGFVLGRNIHITDGDNLVNNPGQEIAGVQRFLNVPVLLNESIFYFNKEKGFHCVNVSQPWLRRVLKSAWRFDKTTNLPGCLGKGKGREHLTISPEERRALIQYYEPYNADFFELIGRTFTSWSQ